MKRSVVSLFAVGLVSCGAGGGGGEPPPEVMASCVRLVMPDGFVRPPSIGDVKLSEFVSLIAENKNAALTWEEDGNGSYILHDLVEDKVSGTPSTLDFKFDRTEAGATGVSACGPGQVVVTRVLHNGVELRGMKLPMTVDVMLNKIKRE